MEHVSSLRPVFPVGISERNFVFHLHGPLSLYQFQVHGKKICRAPRRTGLRPNGTTFYQSEIPLLLPPKFLGFFSWMESAQNTPIKRNFIETFHFQWWWHVTLTSSDVIEMTLLRLAPQTVSKKNPTIWDISEAFMSNPRRSKETA